MTEQYLYQELDVLKKVGLLEGVPQYIKANLNKNIVLRDYQKEAFRYFISYCESEDLRKNKQIHNLFHMATGSGKTVIMAGLILYFYMQGYRKFLFFVNQRNIIEKTKENFLNSASLKYLFAQQININNQPVSVREVDNFESVNDNDINIHFSTIQGLHSRLNTPRENSVTFEDFAN